MARAKKIGNENFKNLILDIIKYHSKLTRLKEETAKFIKLVQTTKNDYPSSLSDIGKKYGYSREYIRQIIQHYDLPNPYELGRKRIKIGDIEKALQKLNPGTRSFFRELKNRLKKIQTDEEI